jgi:hypothetical protein
MVALGLEPRIPVFDTSCCSSPPSLALLVVPLRAVLVESCGERNDQSILRCYTHSVCQCMAQRYRSLYATNLLGLDQVLRPVEDCFKRLPSRIYDRSFAQPNEPR